MPVWNPWRDGQQQLPFFQRHAQPLEEGERAADIGSQFALSPLDLILGALLTGAVALAYEYAMRVPWIVYVVILTPVVSIWILCARGRWRRRLSDWIRHESLAVRCCPGCGYDLQGLSPARAGLTICPECDAAWRLAAPTVGAGGD